MPAAPTSTNPEASPVTPAMRRRLKLFAVLIGVPALLIVVVAVVVPMLIDSHQYKSNVIALVKEHTGYDLYIDGRVRLHLIPNLRLTVTDIRLANPPGFRGDELARLPWLAVDLTLLPLLAGRIEAGTVSVRGLRVNLERDANGRGNWQATTTVKPDVGGEQAPVAAAPLAAMAVSELDVRDASLHWLDQASDETIVVTAISLQTGALFSGKGIDNVRLQATLLDSNASIDAHGDATLDAAGRSLIMPRLAATFRDLNIAGMQVNGALNTRLTADFAAQRLVMDTLQISARISQGEDRQASVEITTGLVFDLARRRLTKSTLSLKVPAYTLSGVGGALEMNGVLSGDLHAGTYALEEVRGSGSMNGEALGASGGAFALHGSLNADLERQKYLVSQLEIAGSIDGNRLPFEFIANLDLSQRTRTLTATDMRLSIRDWQFDGDLTLRAATSPPGVQGVLDLRVRDQWLAGSFAATESATGGNGVDLRLDMMADLDLQGSGYTLRGRNAVVLRTTVSSADGLWRVSDLQLGARLADASFPDGALKVDLRADVEIDVNNAALRSANLRAAVDDSHIAGSVNVRGLDDPTVVIDLEVDSIDADRYLLPTAGAWPRAMPVGVSIDAIRALDLSGEVRVRKLKLKGVQMEDVRLTAGGGLSGG